MPKTLRKQQTSISLTPDDLTFARENRLDLSAAAAAHIAAERRKKEIAEAFRSIEPVMATLMADKDRIADYVRSKQVW